VNCIEVSFYLPFYEKYFVQGNPFYLRALAAFESDFFLSFSLIEHTYICILQWYFDYDLLVMNINRESIMLFSEYSLKPWKPESGFVQRSFEMKSFHSFRIRNSDVYNEFYIDIGDICHQILNISVKLNY